MATADREQGADLSEHERTALRVLRPLVQSALNHASDELISRGRQLELSRCFEALAVIDRLIGSAAATYSREEHQLTCIRVGTAAGYTVAFSSDGTVAFLPDGCAIDELLEVEGPIDEPLRQYLAALDTHHEAFAGWVRATSDAPEGES
jgi:hypothetical protein